MDSLKIDLRAVSEDVKWQAVKKLQSLGYVGTPYPENFFFYCLYASGTPSKHGYSIGFGNNMKTFYKNTGREISIEDLFEIGNPAVFKGVEKSKSAKSMISIKPNPKHMAMYKPAGMIHTFVKKSLPLLKPHRGRLYHMVKHVTMQTFNGESHFIVKTWCGSSFRNGGLSKGQACFSDIPAGMHLVCAACGDKYAE